MNANRLCILFCATLVLSALLTVVGFTAEPPNREFLEKEYQARQFAEETLKGRTVRIRVYPHWQKDANDYTLADVPLMRLYITADRLRIACARMPRYASAVSLPWEQIHQSCRAAHDALQQVVASVKTVYATFDELLEQAASLKQLLTADERTDPSAQQWAMPRLLTTIAQARGALKNLTESIDQLLLTVDKMNAADRSNVALILESYDTIKAGTDGMPTRLLGTGRTLTDIIYVADALKSDLRARAEHSATLTSALDSLSLAIHRMVQATQKVREAGNDVSPTLGHILKTVDGVRHDLDERLQAAVVIITADDQKDQAVAAMLQGFVHAHKYSKGLSVSIWPETARRRQTKPCIFKDADYAPLANAVVEIRFFHQAYPWLQGPQIAAVRFTLDENGQAIPPTLVQELPAAFFVLHEDCGPVYARDAISTNFDDKRRQFHVAALPKSKWTVFTDALGQPIPNAVVDIYWSYQYEKDQIARPLITTQLDAQGRLKPPFEQPRLAFCHFIVSHPDYGRALVEPKRSSPDDHLLKTCIVPLVKIGAEAQLRSIWGTVVDPNSKPVRGAIITCSEVSVPGGAVLRSQDRNGCRTITDEQGFFCMYLPAEDLSHRVDALIPLASKYRVQVDAPKELYLRRLSTNIDSGEETIIVLQSDALADGQNRNPRTLVFEDLYGPITDPNFLKEIRITISSRGRGGYGYGFTYDAFLGDRQFRPGTYTAAASYKGDKYLFGPVDVNEKTPDPVVLRIRNVRSENITYKGRVANGITGGQMAGIIVMIYALTNRDASSLASDQWDAIHSLEPPFDANVPALQPLRDIFRFTQITKTDPAGQFQFILRPADLTGDQGFAAVEEDFLGAQCPVEDPAGEPERLVIRRSRDVEIDQDGNVILRALRLYPAAKIIVEPNMPMLERDREPRIRYYFRTPADDTTPWLADFWKTNHVYVYELQPNQVQTVCVPAGISVTLRFYDPMPFSTSAPTDIPGIKLNQGQVLDLGKVTFEPLMEVNVRVVDSAGKPVEGVAVSVVVDNFYRPEKPSITNSQGIAPLLVPPQRKGRFEVSYSEPIDPNKPLERPIVESVPYQVAGREDQGKEFTLRLSDQMLKLLGR